MSGRPQRGSTRLHVVQAYSTPDGWEADNGPPPPRSQCVDGPRPCDKVRCRYHLWTELAQDKAGNWQLGKGGGDTIVPHSQESCALDIADRGPTSSEDIGRYIGTDETRVRQIDRATIDEKLRRALKREGMTFEEFIQSWRALGHG